MGFFQRDTRILFVPSVVRPLLLTFTLEVQYYLNAHLLCSAAASWLWLSIWQPVISALQCCFSHGLKHSHIYTYSCGVMADASLVPPPVVAYITLSRYFVLLNQICCIQVVHF